MESKRKDPMVLIPLSEYEQYQQDAYLAACVREWWNHGRLSIPIDTCFNSVVNAFERAAALSREVPR